MGTQRLSPFLHSSQNVRLSRRHLLRDAAVVGVAGGLVVRGGHVAFAAPARQQPTQGGTLGVGLPIEPDILDPHVGSSRYDTVVERMLFDSLVYRTEKGGIPPLPGHILGDQ
jgi:ABC-type transport system substrate-binding protein